MDFFRENWMLVLMCVVWISFLVFVFRKREAAAKQVCKFVGQVLGFLEFPLFLLSKVLLLVAFVVAFIIGGLFGTGSVVFVAQSLANAGLDGYIQKLVCGLIILFLAAVSHFLYRICQRVPLADGDGWPDWNLIDSWPRIVLLFFLTNTVFIILATILL